MSSRKTIKFREIGLREDQWERIEEYARKRGYKSISAALREIVDIFFTSSHRTL